MANSSSIMAKSVAKEVIKAVRVGKKPNVYQIAVSKGYSPQSAKASKPQRTKAYQEVMKPFVDGIEEERAAALQAMKKKRKNAKYRDLGYVIDVLTKNHQLLTGGATSNVAIGVRRMNDADLEHIANGGEEGTSEEGTSEA